MNLVNREQAEDLLSLQRGISMFDAELVVIGAIALRAFIPGSSRHTEDVDVALALDLDNFGALEIELNSNGWARDPFQEQRWRGPCKSRMDIIPAGPGLRVAGQLRWPKSGMVMDLTGFDYAFEHATEIELAPGLQVKAVPPPVLFLLKVVAYLDDPHQRRKDLEDVHILLKSYSENDSDRMFSDTVFAADLPDVEYVPAFLLGMDLASFLRVEARGVIESGRLMMPK